MSLSEIRSKEIEYCSGNIVYFTEKYGHIEDRTKPGVIVPFTLWKEQKQALLDMQNHKWTIVLKARQLGISWLVLHYAAHLMLCRGAGPAKGFQKERTEKKRL